MTSLGKVARAFPPALSAGHFNAAYPRLVMAGYRPACFRMLADGTRVRLLWELQESERSVNQLAEAVGKSAPAVSQHLAKLRMARMVRTRREGNQVFYRVENEHVASLVARCDPQRRARLGRHPGAPPVQRLHDHPVHGE